MRTLAALFIFAVLTLAARALPKEPWLKAGDVVALVGGEDMVALAEEGWLETLVTWAQPRDRIRFRSLAWEGDTVFEQRRDLNYPTLETQLDRMGATVVICQFGKMESFAGKEGVAAFTEAYEKLLARLSGEQEWRFVLDGKFDPNPRSSIIKVNRTEFVTRAWLGGITYERDGPGGEKKRRIALVLPPRFGGPPEGANAHNLPNLTFHNADLDFYREAGRTLAVRRGGLVLNAGAGPIAKDDTATYPTRDGIHLKPVWQFALAVKLARGLCLGPADKAPLPDAGSLVEQGRAAIQAKNRLWFHYTRPQNWAFLAGNRTNQPSSRDHLDPTKRWFPEEMEQWLPLIAAKEREIQTLAAAPR